MSYRISQRTLISGVTASSLILGCLAVPHSGAAHQSAAASFPYTISGVTQVAQLVGSPTSLSINKTTAWGVCGGDLGSVMVSGGKAYLTLGDNYTTCPPGTGGPADGLAPPDWRSNAIGIISNPKDFTNGLHITSWYSKGGHQASEVIPSQHGANDCQDTEAAQCEITTIPTYSFAVQQHFFLAYMSVHHWGVGSVWDVNYSSFSMSANGGKTWTVERNKVQWGAKSNFAQVATTPDPDGSHLLFFGIPGGRFGSVKLMRTTNTWQGVLSAKSYQYFTGMNAAGQPVWSSNAARATVVAGAPVGELSVIYDPGLKQWLMTYLQGGNDDVKPSSDSIVIRSALHYWGPWSSPSILVDNAAFPGLYGAFMNPHFLTNNGRTLYFVMSEWGPYSVFWMRATLQPKHA